MSSRDAIFSKVRAALTMLPERPPLPDRAAVARMSTRLSPASTESAALEAAFIERWRETGGVLLRSLEELERFLGGEKATLGYVDPQAADHVLGLSIPVQAVYERSKVDDIHFGITLASMGIAETGTVVLTDANTSNRLGALAPWIHVAVLPRSAIKASMAAAIEAFDRDPSIIFVTGPSKTADIEGILIQGVHGPGKQACLLV